MHFALPPRKSSHPPPYHGGRSSKPSMSRRLRKRTLAYLVGVVAVLYLLWSFSKDGAPAQAAVPPGTPTVVLVTTMTHTQGAAVDAMIEANRRTYAARHGYAVFLADAVDYNFTEPSSPLSWAKLPSLRHAMTLHPHSTHFFYIGEEVLVARPDLSVEEHLTSPARLEELMIRDRPVVPPDSVIKTYKDMKGGQVELVLTQDSQGLNVESFVVKRGEWAKFLLDSWFDPLYRTYEFQHAERHALEHLVQWHWTVLARLALVPQHVMNSYKDPLAKGPEAYKEGDFVANFRDCKLSGRGCENEMRPLFEEVQAQYAINPT